MMGLIIRLGRAPVRFESANPFDQGLHDYIIYKKMFDGNITIPTNEDGFVFHNVCWEDSWSTAENLPPELRFINVSPEHAKDPIGKLMNGKRTMVASLVHQYDRCRKLNDRVLKHYHRPLDQ